MKIEIDVEILEIIEWTDTDVINAIVKHTPRFKEKDELNEDRT